MHISSSLHCFLISLSQLPITITLVIASSISPLQLDVLRSAYNCEVTIPDSPRKRTTTLRHKTFIKEYYITDSCICPQILLKRYHNIARRQIQESQYICFVNLIKGSREARVGLQSPSCQYLPDEGTTYHMPRVSRHRASNFSIHRDNRIHHYQL